MPPTFEYVTLGNEPVWKDTDTRYAKLLVINQDDTYEDVAPFPQLPTAAPHLFCARCPNAVAIVGCCTRRRKQNAQLETSN